MTNTASFVRNAVVTLMAFGVVFAAPLASAQKGKQKGPAAPWVGKTAEGQRCTGGQPTSGPFDYLQRRRFAGELNLVEEHHFNRNVEKLIKGLTTEPMGDIDFTLRAFPNHHRALNSAVTFRLRHKRWPKKSKGRQAECYLQRAINFSPKDPTLQPLLAYVLHRLGKPARALEAYEKAVEIHPEDTMLKYNMGLALTEMKRYKRAAIVAKEVYDLGFPLPALRKRLIAVGEWPESADGAGSENGKKQNTKAPGTAAEKKAWKEALENKDDSKAQGNKDDQITDEQKSAWQEALKKNAAAKAEAEAAAEEEAKVKEQAKNSAPGTDAEKDAWKAALQKKAGAENAADSAANPEVEAKTDEDKDAVADSQGANTTPISDAEKEAWKEALKKKAEAAN